MYTAIRPQKVHARVYEYMQDTLASAADNKAVEGADPSMATLTATTMNTGNTQILTKAFQVKSARSAYSRRHQGQYGVEPTRRAKSGETYGGLWLMNNRPSIYS